MKLALACLVVVVTGCGIPCENSHLEKKQKNRSDRSHSNTNPGQPKPSRNFSIEENDRFPIKPHDDVTPGELCSRASELRYPERIKYCNRDVDRELKAQIFVEYDRRFGYETTHIDRMQFKIDHLLPLCMGGSNHQANLWPQHQSVYALTDPIEPFLCERMAAGKMKQADAVRIIREVKQDPATTDARMDQIDRGIIN